MTLHKDPFAKLLENSNDVARHSLEVNNMLS